MKDPLISVRLLFILSLSLTVATEPFQGIGSQLPGLDDSPFNENKMMDDIKRSLSLKYQALVKKVFNRDISAEESILENGAFPDSLFANAVNSSRSLTQLNKSRSPKISAPLSEQPSSIATDSGVDRVELQLTTQSGDIHTSTSTATDNSNAESANTVLTEGLNNRELKNGKSDGVPKTVAQGQKRKEVNSAPSPYPFEQKAVNLHFNSAEERQIKRQSSPALFSIKRTSDSPFFKKPNSLLLDSRSSVNDKQENPLDKRKPAFEQQRGTKTSHIAFANIRNKPIDRKARFEKLANPKAKFYRKFNEMMDTSHSPGKQATSQKNNGVDLEEKTTSGLLTRSLARPKDIGPFVSRDENETANAKLGNASSALLREDKRHYVSDLRKTLNEQKQKPLAPTLKQMDHRPQISQDLQLKGVKATSTNDLHKQFNQFKEAIAQQGQVLNSKLAQANQAGNRLRNEGAAQKKKMLLTVNQMESQRPAAPFTRTAQKGQSVLVPGHKLISQGSTQRKLISDSTTPSLQHTRLFSQAKDPIASSSTFSDRPPFINNRYAMISNRLSQKASL